MFTNLIEQFITNNLNDFPLPAKDEEIFSMELFLFDASESMRRNSKETFRILDMLCKKVDVTGTIYSCYTKQFQSLAKKEILSPKCYVNLCAIFILGSLIYADLKFLNTALKMLDNFPNNQVDDKLFLRNITLEALNYFFNAVHRSR